MRVATQVLDPAVSFNPLDPSFMRDPGPVLDFARRERPVFFSPVVNAWVVTRFDDVEAILRQPERFTSHEILSISDLLSPPVRELVSGRVPMEGTLIGLDGSMHTRLRRVLSHAFTLQRVRELERDVADLTDSLIADFRRIGNANLVTDLCYSLPLWTITRLIGIPDEEIGVFRQGVEDWAELTTAYLFGAPLERQIALAERIIALHERVTELFDERRRNPRNDLLSAIVAREVPDELTAQEMLSLVPGLFLAGHETTAQTLAMGVHHLLEDRRLWWKLVDDPAQVEPTVEELLRRDGPVFGMWRNVAEDCEIAGTAVPAGSRLYLSFWSANLDETRFESPLTIDTARASRLHLAFGRGVHYCIGAPLARMELRVALSTLVRDFPDLRLARNFAPTYNPHFFLRGLSRLDVESITVFAR